MIRTPAQQQRQERKHRDNGRYAKVNPCYACGKSAGVDYYGHPRSDTTDANGENWGDSGLCLCGRCAKATDHMTLVADFLAYAARMLP